MWSAFMDGSGQRGGGGAGGGYVPSQGWEFVPCSKVERADRGRGKSRSPLRRISSPPTLFSLIGPAPGAGEESAGVQLEVPRGQKRPGSEAQKQQHLEQTHHARMKKKLDDVKKRHVQDKEAWMREKESLLREVANIQGGENRRILLDLKTVLEEVQVEVKREEEKRSELELQYTKDRCAWELEKAELKRRIAQLEAREVAGLASGGAPLATGPGFVAGKGNLDQLSDTSTFLREREEQRRLLADTRSTTMDLRCRLEHNERDWLREKAELLDRFDKERREWESQLKNMQMKIEELYCEVRAKREGSRQDGERQEDDVHRLGAHSISTASSVLSDNSHSELRSSSSQSEPNTHLPASGFSRYGILSNGGGRDQQIVTPCQLIVGDQFSEHDHIHPELMGELLSGDVWVKDPVRQSKESLHTSDLQIDKAPACGMTTRDYEKKDYISPLLAELSYGSNKKKSTTALNAALKEIARVSEELCSYQDEIRSKSGDKRNQCESLPEEGQVTPGVDKTGLELDDAQFDLSQIFDDLRALEKENWIILSPDNTWRINRGTGKSRRKGSTDPDSYNDAQTNPRAHFDMNTDAPAIPLRTSSWNLSTPNHPETELHIPESPMTTLTKCHSPCVVVDRKCSSPSIVRKFEAMLQENEGKVLIDGVAASCHAPANSNCNIGCCHNRWSCDASKFSNNKLSTYGTVQKSFSEVNILSAGKGYSNFSPGVETLQSPELQMPSISKELPVDLLLSSLEIPPASSSLQGSKRNIMLEQKTAEFNRTLFQAEMGRELEEEEDFIVKDGCSLGCQPVLPATCASNEVLFPREHTFQPHCTDVTPADMGLKPEAALSVPSSDSHIQDPEVKMRQSRCNSESEEVRIKHAIPSDFQSQLGLGESITKTSQIPVHHTEVKHKVQTASSPSRKTQHRAAAETSVPEPVLSPNTQQVQSVGDSSSRSENLVDAKPQPARVSVSPRQSSAESKYRDMTQQGHQAQLNDVSVLPSQSDTSRPGPRMMNDHPWKPLTLAAYPRPEGSRSNYGAVEKILKHYESAARGQQDDMASSAKQEENVQEVKIKDTQLLTLFSPRNAQSSLTQTNITHSKLSSHSNMGVKTAQLKPQEKDDSGFSSSSTQKGFSRPARPANRRLPSRWATRSPTSSSPSSTSPSPSTTPVIAPSFPLQKYVPSFTCSSTLYKETVMI